MFEHIDAAGWTGVNTFHRWPMPTRSEGIAGDPDTGWDGYGEEEEPVEYDDYMRERALFRGEDY